MVFADIHSEKKCIENRIIDGEEQWLHQKKRTIENYQNEINKSPKNIRPENKNNPVELNWR